MLHYRSFCNNVIELVTTLKACTLCVLIIISLYRTRKKTTKKQLKHSRNRDPGYQLPNLVTQWATTQFLNLSHVKLCVQKSGTSENLSRTSGILKVTCPGQVAEFFFCTALRLYHFIAKKHCFFLSQIVVFTC